VQDAYSDVESAQYANMYLPAAIWAEKDGCFTNTERRVNRITNIQQPHANSKPDLWIFNQLAKRFDHYKTMTFPDTAEGVFEEMKALSKGKDRTLDISGMSYEKIEQQRGIQWPCREGDATGAQRLYVDGKFQTKDGTANLIALPFIDNNERPDNDFPFWLNTGRVVEHFHTRTRTGKMGNCNKYSPTPYMEMNPDAAADLGIDHQSYVRVVSKRSDAVVMVQLTQRIPYNMVFIPFHFHDCANRLTLGLLDPYSRQPAFKQNAVRIEQIDQQEAAQRNLESRSF
jgi:ferredoxin-nitrate reductase